MELYNAYDIATEQAIMNHAYAPALVRRNKEAHKALKYAARNAEAIGDDVRLQGKFKYRDYVRYCERVDYHDCDDNRSPRARGGRPKVSAHELEAVLKTYAEPIPEPTPAMDYDYDAFVEEDNEPDSLILIIAVAVITFLVALLAR